MLTQSFSSSNLSQGQYDPDKKILIITFNSGDRYQYAKVPQGTWDGLIKASSAGSYFHGNIRTNFNYIKV